MKSFGTPGTGLEPEAPAGRTGGPALVLARPGPHTPAMEILFYLIPIALLLLAVAVGIFFWAVRSGQYDDMEGPAHRILMDDDDLPPKPPRDTRR